MISPDYVRTMAAYNAWQNDGLYAAADGLTEAERRTDRAAFFGSIHGTLAHILWGDRIWMHRFAATPKPNISNIARSVDEKPDWTELKAARQAFDRTIADWADGLAEADLAGDMTWHSAAVDREVSKPHWLLVTHFLNHQTHHRGQVHAMLTAAGAAPGDTDLFLMPAQ
ncbi:MAG: DinB family protein [Alphaproteobacteria bacterium]|nr:DinB family protein [Alphaproteobacteria bacterium]